ncbi:MAG: hypothetical protein QXM38_03375 [Candidatus Aenigmatarchaeota archaeon]
MPAKTIRKLLRHGKSLVVSVPADYIRYYQLKAGEEVELLYDNFIFLIPKQSDKSLLQDRILLIKQLLEGVTR